MSSATSLNWLEKCGRLATYIGPSRAHKELFKSIVFQLPIGSRQAARLTEKISMICTQLFVWISACTHASPIVALGDIKPGEAVLGHSVIGILAGDYCLAHSFALICWKPTIIHCNVARHLWPDGSRARQSAPSCYPSRITSTPFPCCRTRQTHLLIEGHMKTQEGSNSYGSATSRSLRLFSPIHTFHEAVQRMVAEPP